MGITGFQIYFRSKHTLLYLANLAETEISIINVTNFPVTL